MTSRFARLIWAGTTVAVLCAIGVTNASAAGAGRHTAAAAPPGQPLESYSVTSSSSIVTSRHVHLQLSLRAEYANNDVIEDLAESAHPADLSVELATPSDSENHNWDFELPDRMVRAKPSKGSGSVNTHSKIQPFGSVRFTFQPVGTVHSKTLCPEVTSTHQTVRLTEHLAFDTRSKGKHRWGSVAGTFHARGALDATYGNPGDDGSCFKIPKQQCVPGASGDAFSAHPPADESDDLFVSPSATGETIVGERGIALAKPREATRGDQVTVRAKPFTVHLNGDTFSAKVTAKSGPVTGSGTFSSTELASVSPDTQCKGSGSFSQTTYHDPTFANGTKPLRFHEAIEGGFGIIDKHLEDVELTSIQEGF